MESKRVPALDGLRAISILLVLSSHMLPLGPKFLGLNWTAGAMGMSLFFCLSGFLICSTLIANSDVREFIIRRLTRILPLAYAFSFLLLVFLLIEAKTFLSMVFFVLNYFPDHITRYNAHFWSLCIEVQFYLAIAIVVYVIGKNGIWVVWPVCVLITLMRVSEGAYIHIQTHLRADEILAGACVATVYRKQWTSAIFGSTSLLVLSAVLWLVASSPYTGGMQYLRPYATALLLLSTLNEASSGLGRLLASAPMRYIATTSYALYVIHPITIQGWWNEGNVIDRYIFKRPVSICITFIAAHLSTFYWERVWLHLGKQWIERLRPRRLQLTPHS